MSSASWTTFSLVLVLLFVTLPHHNAFTYSKRAIRFPQWRNQLSTLSHRAADSVATSSTAISTGALISQRGSSSKPLAAAPSLLKSRSILPIAAALCSSGLLLFPSRVCLAQPVADVSVASASATHPLQTLGLWATLFTLSALLHSAECAITKISPWKVQQFAEAEGQKSAFATLSRDLTRLLVTILLTSTACSIYSTALFVSALSALFPRASLASITAALTVLTLLVGEVIPKAVAVGNSEVVTRLLVPPLARLASLLHPITSLFTMVSDFTLRWAGLRSVEDKSVSEDMLRRVVNEAEKSGAQGILQGEGRMIKAVLDMQDKEVGKIMRPRVDIVAIDETASALQLLQVAQATKVRERQPFVQPRLHPSGNLGIWY